MKLKILIVFITILFAFYGCSNDAPVQPDINNQEQGNVTIAIPKTAIPQYVATITAVLTRDGYEPIEESVYVFDGPSADIIFNEIIAGTWHLEVNAYSSDNTILYSGDTDVTVNPGQQTNVNLTLSAATGSINLTVTWDTGTITGWHLSEENPVLTYVEAAIPNVTGIRYPLVYKVGNQWRMIFTTSYYEYYSSAHCAISDDGENWTLETTNEILHRDGYSWDGLSISGQAIVKFNGVYYLYYGVIHGAYNQWMLGVATSTDGKTWTKQPEPIMTGQEWYYAFSVRSAIVKDGQVYLYFTGMNSAWQNKKFGLMTSENGIDFSMHQNNPILETSYDWEGDGIDSPYVIETDDGYEMYYTSVKSSENHIGKAVSSDGVNWQKLGNPILEHNSVVLFDNDERALYPSVIENNGVTYLYYTVFQQNQTFSDYIALIKKY